MTDSPITARSPRDGIAHHAARAVSALIITVVLLGVCWALEVVNYGGGLTRDYGIQPHNVNALWHIFTAPFLHANLDHIMANSVPLAILGFLTALRGLGRFVTVSLIVMVVSGLGVWLLAASNVVTVGASGLIFGYFGYLLARGFFERRILDILLGVVIALVYGTMIFGVLPGQPGISWQAHLFGLIGGVLAARLTRSRSGPAALPPAL
ncbi:rhomboid family intramembrane serine protease [Actinoallomurus spadix]|uniref:Rhomboid family intramembrane serine protease n=1 Tax=Actinoallomurus spadix TaxID=79912 RepID=A0ABN0XAG5_9ACTN|nr:rhomboid family intramembrane serine protease [Actinoallomurus spadix]MCO5987840.1 rhomboid family intramembrane serine protease [Actinoallomurus spadix]